MASADSIKRRVHAKKALGDSTESSQQADEPYHVTGLATPSARQFRQGACSMVHLCISPSSMVCALRSSVQPPTAIWVHLTSHCGSSAQNRVQRQAARQSRSKLQSTKTRGDRPRIVYPAVARRRKRWLDAIRATAASVRASQPSRHGA